MGGHVNDLNALLRATADSMLDPQVILDLSLDYARMGDVRRAFELV